MAETSSGPATDIGHWFESAVLVYGPRKGGTTLLQNLIDGSEDLFVYPVELKLKRFLFSEMNDRQGNAIYARESRIPAVPLPHFDLARYRHLMEGLAQSDSIRGLKSLIRADLQFVRDCAGYGAARPPQAWAAKEVGGRTEAIVRWWLENFARPRVVFIMRDPLMITRAVLRTRRRVGEKQTIGSLIYETFDPLRVMRAQAAFIDHPNVLAIAYEDLVADPPAVMARIAQFIGVPYGQHLTQPSIFGESVVVVTASKQSKNVFADNVSWTDGLSLRERMAVRLLTLFAACHPGLRFNYAALRARLKSKASTAQKATFNPGG